MRADNISLKPKCPWMNDHICALNNCAIYIVVDKNKGACAFQVLGAKALTDYMKGNENAKGSEERNNST